jgi:hypothetical protein
VNNQDTGTVAIATTFFEYAEQHQFTLFPLRPGTKDPFKDSQWSTTDNSRDPAQWRAWQAERCNLAIFAGGSRLIIVDIDVKELGQKRAWELWCAWCNTRRDDLTPHSPQPETLRLSLSGMGGGRPKSL